MSRMNKIRSRIMASRKLSSRRELVRFAKTASQNAKRSSIALDIPYEIIKDGGIYQVFEGSMIRTATLQRPMLIKVD